MYFVVYFRTAGHLNKGKQGTSCRWTVDRGQVQRRKWARSTLATAGMAVALLRSAGPRSIAKDLRCLTIVEHSGDMTKRL